MPRSVPPGYRVHSQRSQRRNVSGPNRGREAEGGGSLNLTELDQPRAIWATNRCFSAQNIQIAILSRVSRSVVCRPDYCTICRTSAAVEHGYRVRNSPDGRGWSTILVHEVADTCACTHGRNVGRTDDRPPGSHRRHNARRHRTATRNWWEPDNRRMRAARRGRQWDSTKRPHRLRRSGASASR